MDDVIERIKAERDHTARARDRALDEVTRLDAKLAEFDAAIRVIERMTKPTEARHNFAKTGENKADALLHQLDHRGRGAQKSMIREVLEPDTGLTVAGIQERISKKHGADVTVNTISVTLLRLRNEGFARLEDRHWFRARSAETAGFFNKDAPAAPNPSTKEAEMDPPE